MRRSVHLGSAADDLDAIAAHLVTVSRSPEVAPRLDRVLRARCRRLAALPGTPGRARPERRADLRGLAHRDHVVLFRYVGNAVEIDDVIEGHRDIAAHVRGPSPEGDDTA